MSNPGLLLIGAGGHAKSCIDVIEQENKFKIIGLVGSPNEVGTHVHISISLILHWLQLGRSE
jgi:hypothetical protein